MGEAPPNPYRPGNGLEPPYLAGRQVELKAMNGVLSELGRFPRNVALYGLRGVGKTCLLREYRLMALERGHIVIRREFNQRVQDETSFAVVFLSDLQDAVEELSAIEAAKGKLARLLTAARDSVGSLRLKYQELEFSLEAGQRGGRGGILEDDFRKALARLGEAASERDTGVVVLYDEFQELQDTKTQNQLPLGALISALSSVQQDGLPITLVACGLPPLIENLADAQSYTERMFEGQQIGALVAPENRRALVAPLRGTGYEYADRVVEEVLESTGGYPYFIQHYGRELWDAAAGPRIDLDVYRSSEDQIRAKLDSYFFRARYMRATPAEKEVLARLAEFGESAQIQDLPEAGGRSYASVQMVIRGLVNKGLVYRPTRGEVAFSAPLFGDYIRRKAGEL
jgi:hypothetical protein